MDPYGARELASDGGSVMGEIASLLPLIQGVSSAAGGAANASAAMAEGRFARSTGNVNAQLAQQQALQAMQAGQQNAALRMEEGAQAASASRASLASQGVDPNTGSAAAVQQSQLDVAARDAEMIRHNASLQSWGYGVEAINHATQGRMGYIASRNRAGQSIAQGGIEFARYGLQAYDEWHKRRMAEGASEATSAAGWPTIDRGNR